MFAYRPVFMLTAPPCDSTDSDGDSDECDARSIVESGRPTMIQLIEYACPKQLTTGRLSTFGDEMLVQTAVVAFGPDNCTKPRTSFGVTAIRSLKRVLRCIAGERRVFRDLTAGGLDKLEDIAIDAGYRPAMVRSSRQRRQRSSGSMIPIGIGGGVAAMPSDSQVGVRAVRRRLRGKQSADRS